MRVNFVGISQSLIIISRPLRLVVKFELQDLNNHLNLEKANDRTILLRNRFAFKQ